MKTLLIIGAGGLGREVLDIIRESHEDRYQDVSFIDDAVKPETVVHGVRVIGDRTILGRIRPGTVDICIAVGNPALREDLIRDIDQYGHSFATIMDPSALVRSCVTVHEGAIVGARAVISCNAIIGAHAVINIDAVVGHDVSIGSYTVIGAGALLSGGASIGEGALIGAGASILLGTTVGNWSKVAMGAVVFTDVADRTTVLGNPARALPIRGEARGPSKQVPDVGSGKREMALRDGYERKHDTDSA
jgi:acetyltransferase EpsM